MHEWVKKTWVKKTFIIVVSIIVLIAFIWFFVWLIDSSIEKYVSIKPGTWLATGGTIVGAFLGAALAGFFSLRSVKKQIQNENEARAEENRIIRESAAFKFSYTIFEIQLAYKDIIKDVDEKSLKILVMERELRILKSLYSSLDNIDITVLEKKELQDLHREKKNISNRLFDFEMVLEEFEHEYPERESRKEIDISHFFKMDDLGIDILRDIKCAAENSFCNLIRDFENKYHFRVEKKKEKQCSTSPLEDTE
ncbi:hypothetical protein [Marinococcus luteus]|uniref:hypothetical protein n=1 Tax=Marinococcus luteus TaxID=1122204 RepID=UPI002ACC7EB6|nr:hypothetical protein [Marinococcus luteus]MDZ5782093.1 hypothetical protein [Marinococcus luteus]